VVSPEKPIVYGIVQAGPHIEDGVPYIRSTDVGGEIDIMSLRRTSPEIAAQYKRAEVQAGDIVFSLRGNIGATSIVPTTLTRANLTQGTARISVRSDLSADFVRFALQGAETAKQIESVAKGSTFREISLEELRKITILLPTLSEQKKIAEILICWEAANKQVERLITEKSLLKKGLMQLLLLERERSSKFPTGWSSYSLGKLLGRATNGLVNNQVEQSANLARVTRIETISDGTVNVQKVGFVNYADNLKEYRLQRGDILFSNINSLAHIGKSAIFDSDEELYHGMNLLLLRPNERIRPFYLYFLINSEPLRRAFKRMAKQAVNQASISLGEIKAMQVKIPDLEEQIYIENILISATSEIARLSDLRELLQLQKRGLLQQLLVSKKKVKVL
jgi:type I restriction enzyme S subunit